MPFARGFESLERRTLLSVGPQWLPQSVLLQPGGYPKVIDVPFAGDGAQATEGRWIVQFDGFEGDARQQLRLARSLLQEPGNAVSVRSHLGADGLFLIDLQGATRPEQIHAAVGAVPGFRYAEPDFAFERQVLPNDTSYGSLWGMTNIQAPQAWDSTTGSSDVIVAVVDSGIDYTHPDLANNIWTNPGEVANNGVDDDGNGFVDDFYGWDWWSNDKDPRDENGHGTHVAGTIGAVGNNNRGVTGVNWNVKLMALKIGGSGSSVSTSAAVSALNYVRNMRNRGVNVKVANHSWGGPGFSSSLESAIVNSGVVNVAASGNDGLNNDTNPHYPSSFDLTNLISVANINSANQLNGSSNYGLTSVDLGAPGTSILSTTPGNTYSFFTGTSMASPHVAGAAALLYAADPTASIAAVRDALLNSTTPTSSLSGKTVTGGRLNVFNALNYLTSLPGSPTAPVLTTATDSGPSTSDGVTNMSNVIFTGLADAGSTVRLLLNGVQRGTATAGGDGSYSIPVNGLTEGDYAATAIAQVGPLSSAPSDATLITVDTTAPSVSDGEFVFAALPQSLQFAFSEDIGAALLPSSIVIEDLGTGLPLDSGSIGLSFDSGTNVARFTFPGFSGGLVPDGDYRATLSPTNVTDLAGNALAAGTTLDFFFLQGDANRDRRVDVSDLGVLASNWQAFPRTFTDGDLNYSGRVDISDLGILSTQWQKSLASLTAVAAAPVSGVTTFSNRVIRLVDPESGAPGDA